MSALPAFSEKQQEYFNKAVHRWNIKCGATRSGKTYMDYYVIPKRIRAVAGKPGLIVLLGNTQGTLQRNVIEPLQEIWGSTLVTNINSKNKATLFGEECYCLGADNRRRVDKIRGASIKYCYGDEVATWDESIFQMLKSRLDKPYSYFDGTCNPEGHRHWLEKFIESDADIYYQHYTLYDNPFITPEFVANLEQEYRGTVYFNRYVLGEWINAEGLVYPQFDPEKHVIDRYDKRGRYYISCDYGTINPCVFLLWRVNYNLPEEQQIVLCKEYYYDSRSEDHAHRQKTDDEYYDDLRKFATGVPIECVIIDPSAASFKELIKRKGQFLVKNADNDVLNGIRFTSSMLSSGRVKIHRSCTNIQAEFGAYVWDETKGEDTVIKDNDHAMDAMRYLFQSVIRKQVKAGEI